MKIDDLKISPIYNVPNAPRIGYDIEGWKDAKDCIKIRSKDDIITLINTLYLMRDRWTVEEMKYGNG